MENSSNYFLGITVMNIIIFIVSAWLVIFCFKRCFRYRIPAKDHQFYALKLQKCVAFFIFNSIALYVNWRLFYTLDLKLPSDLSFLRYVDRCVCGIYAFYKVLDCTRYYPTNYEIKKTKNVNDHENHEKT